jgi:hypothetical protein
VAWQFNGRTDFDNLAHQCRHHHRLKHQTTWEARQMGDGFIEWTSPLKRRYVTAPDTFFPSKPSSRRPPSTPPPADDARPADQPAQTSELPPTDEQPPADERRSAGELPPIDESPATDEAPTTDEQPTTDEAPPF